MSQVKCVARHAVDLAEGPLVPPGRVAEADLTHPDNRAKVDAGLLVPVAGKPEVADGTVEEVLERVAGDPDRAREALSAELARQERRRRSTLISALEEIAGPTTETPIEEEE